MHPYVIDRISKICCGAIDKLPSHFARQIARNTKGIPWHAEPDTQYQRHSVASIACHALLYKVLHFADRIALNAESWFQKSATEIGGMEYPIDKLETDLRTLCKPKICTL